MEMIRVRSSSIAAVGYDRASRRLRIRFTSGRSYDFCGVPPEVFDRFMASTSKGRFYNDHIRDRYRC